MSYRRTRQKNQPGQSSGVSFLHMVANVVRSLFVLGIQLSIVAALIFVGIIYYISTGLPELDEIVDARYGGSVTFLDRHGEIFAWRGQQFDANITAKNVSKHIIDAIIATEDKRFYQHLGISPRALGRALMTNWKQNGNPFHGQGGSTITTQVAKLMCLGKEYDKEEGTVAEYEAECRRSTIDRKLYEIPYALALEWKFTKDEILTIYLNRAYLGAATYGIGAAAKRYFDTSASGLSVAQSAMLAGMLTAPSKFAPTNNLGRSQERAATVIRLMREQGKITESEANEAVTNPATLSKRATSDAGIFFADWLMKDQPDFLTTETSEDIVFQTTFDPQIQQWAQDAIDKIFTNQVREGSRAQAAIVIMDKTGAVRAMIGGRFDEDRVEQGFNRATDALRQPGSSFKPFVYAAALEKGLRPYQVFDDAPISIQVSKGKSWSPKNYGGNYSGPNTMIDALKKSINTIAVDLQERSGRDLVQSVARELGIKSPLHSYPTLALGSAEVTLLEMVTAYAGILNNAHPVQPYGWTVIGHKRTKEILVTNEPHYGPAVISEQHAGELIWMMKQVVDGGTGTKARISGHEIAGKTGTTSDYKDAWFIGFSGEYICGVWMGYDDNTPLTKVTGGGLPAEIWREAMKPLLQSTGAVPLPMIVPKAPTPPKPVFQDFPNDNLEQDMIDGLLENLTGN